MVVNHVKAIEHMNKQLRKFGVVSFPEINKVAGSQVLDIRTWLGDSGKNKTAKAALKKKDVSLIRLSRGRDSAKGGGSGMGVVYHLVKQDLAPFLEFAPRLGRGPGDDDPVVNTLFKIDNQKIKDNHIILGDNSTGARKLIKLGLLEKAVFRFGTKPKELSSYYRRFKVTKPALLKRVIVAVKQVRALQEDRRGKDMSRKVHSKKGAIAQAARKYESKVVLGKRYVKPELLASFVADAAEKILEFDPSALIGVDKKGVLAVRLVQHYIKRKTGKTHRVYLVKHVITGTGKDRAYEASLLIPGHLKDLKKEERVAVVDDMKLSGATGMVVMDFLRNHVNQSHFFPLADPNDGIVLTPIVSKHALSPSHEKLTRGAGKSEKDVEEDRKRRFANYLVYKDALDKWMDENE